MHWGKVGLFSMMFLYSLHTHLRGVKEHSMCVHMKIETKINMIVSLLAPALAGWTQPPTNTSTTQQKQCECVWCFGTSQKDHHWVIRSSFFTMVEQAISIGGLLFSKVTAPCTPLHSSVLSRLSCASFYQMHSASCWQTAEPTTTMTDSQSIPLP
jgi:hypothetical protein